MRIGRTAISYGPRGTTITATVSGDDPRFVPFDAWYEVPAGWAVDQTASAFLPVGLALATVYDEDLTIDGGVSERLLEGAPTAASLLAAYHGRRTALIQADPIRPSTRPDAPRHAGLFLSRGVDSSLNLVLGERGELEPTPTLAIVMADIEPAFSPQVRADVNRTSIEAAAMFGLDTVLVSTNLRSHLDRHIGWLDVFGCVLAGAAITLSPQLDHAIISSSAADQQMLLGSHKDLDRCWSTEAVQLHHLPLRYDRSERIRLLVDDGRLLPYLKVCWEDRADNCGRCQKCVQTAALLAVFGGLDRATLFPPHVNIEDLRERPPSIVQGADFIRAARPTHPELADAIVLNRGRDKTFGQARPPWTRLHAAARAGHEHRRPVPWCLLGEPGAGTSAVAAAATRRFGPGLVWTGGTARLRPVLDRMLSAATLTVWWSDDDTIDLDRVLDALERGGQPVLVMPPAAAEVARHRLPTALRPLVVTLEELEALDPLPEAARVGLAAAFAAGGTAWLEAPSAPGSLEATG